MTTDPRWAAETEELVAETLKSSYIPIPGYAGTWNEFQANRALTALAAAGLLVEPGGEVRQERRHLPMRRCTGACHGPDLHCIAPEHHETRTVHTSPWREVRKQWGTAGPTDDEWKAMYDEYFPGVTDEDDDA